MNVGVARRDVSPPIGVDLCGFIAREGPSTGVHDPLYATALVASDGDRFVALTVCDLIGLGARTVARLRSAVQQRTGIPAAAQMYACTHTHGGPDTGVITTTGAADPTYLAGMEATIVEAVAEARARMEPARIGWGRGACDAAFNRRQPPGAIWPIDPDLLVARIERLDGSPLATLLHYTCHPTASGPGVRLVTSDWCGVARGILEEAGSGPVLVVNGAAGDVNAKMEARGLDAAERAGRQIGEVALGLWRSAATATASAVAAVSATVPLALAPLPDAPELARLWQEWQRVLRREPHGGAAYRGAMVTLRDYVQKVARLTFGSDPLPEVAVETQALLIGPVVVVSLPGEFFNAYGRQVKAAAPDRPIMVAAWTNDNVGYFPTREQYAYGGYEVEIAYRYYGFPSVWTADSGEAGARPPEPALKRIDEDGAAGSPGVKQLDGVIQHLHHQQGPRRVGGGDHSSRAPACDRRRCAHRHRRLARVAALGWSRRAGAAPRVPVGHVGHGPRQRGRRLRGGVGGVPGRLAVRRGRQRDGGPRGGPARARRGARRRGDQARVHSRRDGRGGPAGQRGADLRRYPPRDVRALRCLRGG